MRSHVLFHYDNISIVPTSTFNSAILATIRAFHVLCSTLRYAIVLPGQKSGFRAGFRPDANRESIKIAPPAAEACPIRIRPKSGLEDPFRARTHLRNIGCSSVLNFSSCCPVIIVPCPSRRDSVLSPSLLCSSLLSSYRFLRCVRNNRRARH